MEYSYLSKILLLKLSDSLKEMFGGIAILYNEKKTVLGYVFFFFLTAFLLKCFIFHSLSSLYSDGKSCYCVPKNSSNLFPSHPSPWKLAIFSPFLACLLLSWIHSSIHFTDGETKAKLNQLPKVTVGKWGTKYVRHYYWDWECRNEQKRQKSLPPRSSPSSYSLHTTIIVTLASPPRHFCSCPIMTHQRPWLQTLVLPSGTFPHS